MAAVMIPSGSRLARGTASFNEARYGASVGLAGCIEATAWERACEVGGAWHSVLVAAEYQIELCCTARLPGRNPTCIPVMVYIKWPGEYYL